MAETDGRDPYNFEWIEAPEDLAPYLNSHYILRVGDRPVVDMMPAYSGQLLLTLRGGGSMVFADRTRADSTVASFQCPLTRSHEFELQPNTIMLGISLNFRGWAALTGLPANEYCDTYIPVERALGEGAGDRARDIARQWAEDGLSERAALDELAAIVRQRIRPLSERHRQVIDSTIDWLSSSLKPEIETLQAMLPYSERQVQRLVARFFGQPPVRLIRRYRAIRAATLLSMPDLSPTLEAEVRDAFYDQAHMIKEIRHFTGRTPRRLQPDQHSVVNETLNEKGYGAVDLFGGNQDEALGRK